MLRFYGFKISGLQGALASVPFDIPPHPGRDVSRATQRTRDDAMTRQATSRNVERERRHPLQGTAPLKSIETASSPDKRDGLIAPLRESIGKLRFSETRSFAPETAPTGAGQMFVEEIRRAVQATPRDRLAEISAAVWKGFAAGAIAEDEAQRLAELIEARKVVPVAPAAPAGALARVRGHRPAWSGEGPGRAPDGCRRPSQHGSRWARPRRSASSWPRSPAAAGASSTSAPSRAGQGSAPRSSATRLRQARSLGLLHVETRRVARDRCLPNVVTIISRELELWVRTRARVERQGGGCRSVLPTTNHILSSSARPATTAWKAGTFDEGSRKVWASRTKAEPATRAKPC